MDCNLKHSCCRTKYSFFFLCVKTYILRKGTEQARATAAQTMSEVRHAMQIDYFDDVELIRSQAERYRAK